ncbi:MAG: GGDEF domain-containing protein [Atopobiaceae bacterium]|nr:GGDEF domain-containing protein [Atopobiaceae bacterium]
MATNVIAYIEMDAVCFVILVLLLIKGLSTLGVRRLQRLYTFMLVCGLIFFALDAVWILLDNRSTGLVSQANPQLYAISMAVRSLYWISAVGLACLAYMYFEANQKEERLSDRRWRLWVAAPFLFVVLLNIINIPTGCLFDVSERYGTYHRGPLFSIQMVVTFGYLALASFRAFIQASKDENIADRSRLLSYAIFPIPVIVGAILQMVFWQFPLLCAGMALALLNLNLDTLQNLVSTDPLTQLNNRGHFMRAMSRALRDSDASQNLYLFMMDVDLFKLINDTYGHVEGDRALQRVAEALRAGANSMDDHGLIARLGGDEFVVLIHLTGDDMALEFCRRLLSALEEKNDAAQTPYRIKMSVGWVRWSPEFGTVQNYMDAADQRLYEQKQLKAAER